MANRKVKVVQRWWGVITGETPKRVVDFPLERDTFRNKIMEIVEDFDEQSYNNNGEPWKSSRILCLNSIFSFVFHFFIFPFFSFFHFFHFFIFFNFLFFFIFFHFLSLSIIFSHFLSFSAIFCHFLTFAFIFFHFLSFSFIFFHLLFLCWVLKI